MSKSTDEIDQSQSRELEHPKKKSNLIENDCPHKVKDAAIKPDITVIDDEPSYERARYCQRQANDSVRPLFKMAS